MNPRVLILQLHVENPVLVLVRIPCAFIWLYQFPFWMDIDLLRLDSSKGIGALWCWCLRRTCGTDLTFGIEWRCNKHFQVWKQNWTLLEQENPRSQKTHSESEGSSMTVIASSDYAQPGSKNLSVNHLRPVLLLWHLLRLLSLSIKAVQVQFLSVNSISVCPAKSTGNFAVALAAPVKAKRASVWLQEREQQILGMNVEQILEQDSFGPDKHSIWPMSVARIRTRRRRSLTSPFPVPARVTLSTLSWPRSTIALTPLFKEPMSAKTGNPEIQDQPSRLGTSLASFLSQLSNPKLSLNRHSAFNSFANSIQEWNQEWKGIDSLRQGN